MSEESIHADRRVRSEVHKEIQRQPSPSPQREGLATNMEGPSYANRDMKVERLRKQVTLLQRNAEKDKELLRCKDKREDECGVGDRNQKRDMRSPYPYRE